MKSVAEFRSPVSIFGKTPSSRFFDIATVSPLLALYGLGCAGLLLKIYREMRAAWPVQDGSAALATVLDCASLAFLTLQFSLLVLRRLPTAKAGGIAPRLLALVGSNAALGFLLIPVVHRSIAAEIASTLVTLFGFVTAIYVLAVLGRSFSIFPQARGLVLAGPYRWIRHPLYLCEQITVLGLMWHYAQPWNFLIFLISILSQIPRMKYEEEILSRTYPAYATYSRHTARVIPGIF